MENLKRSSKDNIHRHFLKLAYEKAKINLGSTGQNPSVGCIVVKDNSIVSSGCTSINGRPHAEFNALNKNINFKGANLYVTLEPCSHYGQTPPCINIIKKKGIKKVYFSSIDFDLRSKGKAKKKLKKLRIKSNSSLMNKFSKEFYKSYLFYHTNNFPYIDAKIALSKDYKSSKKKGKLITSINSRKLAQFLRSRYDCIISTSKSINEDNSKLNCRIEGLENKSPDLIIIDRNLKLKKKLHIFSQKKRKIIIFTASKNTKKINFFKRKSIKVVILKSLTSRSDFEFFFRYLKKLKYSRIFFECGITLLNFLLYKRFLNNLYIFKSDKKLLSSGFNNSSSRLIRNIKLKRSIKVNLKGDNLYKIKFK